MFEVGCRGILRLSCAIQSDYLKLWNYFWNFPFTVFGSRCKTESRYVVQRELLYLRLSKEQKLSSQNLEIR